MLNIKQLHINKTASRGRVMFFMLFLFSAGAAAAQQTTNTAEQSIWVNPVALTLLALILVLLLVIAILANVLLGTAKLHADKQQSSTATAVKTITVLLALFFPAISEAQEAAATSSTSIAGLSATTFYLFIAVLAIELLVILVMSFFVKSFLAKEKVTVPVEITAERKLSFTKTWWEKINSFKPADQEASIDMGHDYDGIRELNNRLPPWWIYGFYMTIFVGVVYLWRYHIAETAPLSKQEFEIEWKRGEEQKAAFLAKAGSEVDENTVVLLKDPAALEPAKAIFKQTCIACHGSEGQGNAVGPNLTDVYWIHGGSIKDIFKIIKYGWPEKGMKSWKDDYSPVQIAQLASYIKSLHGTNPPNPKEKQGELYQENNTAPAKDSAVKVNKAAL